MKHNTRPRMLQLQLFCLFSCECFEINISNTFYIFQLTLTVIFYWPIQGKKAKLWYKSLLLLRWTETESDYCPCKPWTSLLTLRCRHWTVIASHSLLFFLLLFFPAPLFFIALKGTGGNDFAIGSLMWTWSAWLSLHWNCKGVEKCIISHYSSWTVISFTQCTSSYNEQAFIRLLCLLLTYQNVADHWRQEKKFNTKMYLISFEIHNSKNLLVLAFG